MLPCLRQDVMLADRVGRDLQGSRREWGRAHLIGSEHCRVLFCLGLLRTGQAQGKSHGGPVRLVIFRLPLFREGVKMRSQGFKCLLTCGGAGRRRYLSKLCRSGAKVPVRYTPTEEHWPFWWSCQTFCGASLDLEYLQAPIQFALQKVGVLSWPHSRPMHLQGLEPRSAGVSRELHVGVLKARYTKGKKIMEA